MTFEAAASRFLDTSKSYRSPVPLVFSRKDRGERVTNGPKSNPKKEEEEENMASHDRIGSLR